MTRIDFYVVTDTEPEARLLVAARLTDKALGQSHRLFIHTNDKHHAEQLDDLLWAFKPASFVPHRCCSATTEDNQANEPVLIGWQQEPKYHDDVLINLTRTAPAFFSRFQRVIEIVTQDSEDLAALREAWRFYRDRGYPLTKYDL